VTDRDSNDAVINFESHGNIDPTATGYLFETQRKVCGGVRTSDPGAERSGSVHTRVFGVGSRYELCQSESDTSAGCDGERTWYSRGIGQIYFGTAFPGPPCPEL